MKKPTFKVRILDERITLDHLKPAHPGDAGIDLCFAGDGDVDDPYRWLTLMPGEVKLIRTGISIYIEDASYAGMILPRSGLGHKIGLILGNGTGLIDSTYQGELMVSAWNRSEDIVQLEPMSRIAQLIIVPIIRPEFVLVGSFDKSERGGGGFGSTGGYGPNGSNEQLR